MCSSQVSEGLKNLDINLQFPLATFLVAIGFFLVLFMEQLVLWLREAGVLQKRQASGYGFKIEDPMFVCLFFFKKMLNYKTSRHGGMRSKIVSFKK